MGAWCGAVASLDGPKLHAKRAQALPSYRHFLADTHIGELGRARRLDDSGWGYFGAARARLSEVLKRYACLRITIITTTLQLRGSVMKQHNS